MFEWPLDKLDIINSALSQTGDNTVATADDGSEEWNTCSPAYERALAYMIEQHSWRWVSTVKLLQPAANTPSDDQWDTAFNLPADLVHLVFARINDNPAPYELMMGPAGASGPSGVQLVCNAQGGPPPPIPPQTPQPVTIKYISQQASDPQFATPTFVVALTTFVMSGIYRGMHEDLAEANNMWRAGVELCSEAKARHDQQMPKRALYNSRMTASRRIRRPWPPVPGGWSGTGIPG